MARGAGKNGWALFLLILAGVVLGSFISQLTSGVAGLSWLNFGCLLYTSPSPRDT